MVDIKLIIVGVIIFAIGVSIEVVGTVLEEASQTGAQVIGILPIIGGLVIFGKGIKD